MKHFIIKMHTNENPFSHLNTFSYFLGQKYDFMYFLNTVQKYFHIPYLLESNTLLPSKRTQLSGHFLQSNTNITRNIVKSDVC